MGALALTILRVASYVLSGVGVSELMDKFVKPKVPAAYYPENISPGFKVPKLVWLIAAFALGIFAVRYVGRKFKIKLLK